MTREQVAEMCIRWVPYAYQEQRVQSDIEDMHAVLAALQEAMNKLDQCHALLGVVAGSSRPLPGGMQQAALALLQSQGVRR